MIANDYFNTFTLYDISCDIEFDLWPFISKINFPGRF